MSLIALLTRLVSGEASIDLATLGSALAKFVFEDDQSLL